MDVISSDDEAAKPPEAAASSSSSSAAASFDEIFGAGWKEIAYGSCILGSHCKADGPESELPRVSCRMCEKTYHAKCVEDDAVASADDAPSTFICPLCRLRKMDPFAPVEVDRAGTNRGIIEWKLVVRDCNVVEMRFEKPPAWKEVEELQIRAVALEPPPQDGGQGGQGWQVWGPRWPPKLKCFVNGNVAFEIEAKKFGHPRREFTHTIKGKLLESVVPNNVKFVTEWQVRSGEAQPQFFIVAAVVAHPINDEELIARHQLNFGLATEFGVDPDSDWNFGDAVLSKEAGVDRVVKIVADLHDDSEDDEV